MPAKEFYAAHETRMNELNVTLKQLEGYEKRFAEMEKWKDEVTAENEELRTILNRKYVPPRGDELAINQDWHDACMRHWVETAAGPNGPSGEISIDLAGDETRALYQADATTGGYFATTEWINQLLRNIVLYAPIVDYVGNRNTAATSVEMPVYDHSFKATWTGAEVHVKDETTGQHWGKTEITTHEIYALIDISQKDLEDSRFDIEGYMMREFALQFAIAEAEAILLGNGVGQPSGILDPSAALWGGATTAAATALDPNDFKRLFWSLLPQYSRMPGSVWGMHTAIIAAIDEFRGVNEKQYVWAPGLSTDPLKQNLMGHDICVCPEMDDFSSPSEGNVAAFYGNLQRGYLRVNRIDTQILRDPYTQATKGLIRFIARRRVGGKVILPEAIKLLEYSA